MKSAVLYLKAVPREQRRPIQTLNRSVYSSNHPLPGFFSAHLSQQIQVAQRNPRGLRQLSLLISCKNLPRPQTLVSNGIMLELSVKNPSTGTFVSVNICCNLVVFDSLFDHWTVCLCAPQTSMKSFLTLTPACMFSLSLYSVQRSLYLMLVFFYQQLSKPHFCPTRILPVPSTSTKPTLGGRRVRLQIFTFFDLLAKPCESTRSKCTVLQLGVFSQFKGPARCSSCGNSRR